MSTIHIEARKYDIADTVIMPGDPRRVKYIAKKFLEDAKLVNSLREEYGYSGYYKGKRVTVFSSGMGIASMGIYSYELFNFYDVKNIIRIGTCGSFDERVKLGEILLAKEAFSESTYAEEAFEKRYHNIKSSEKLNEIIKETSEELNIEIRPFKIETDEAFYETDIIEKTGVVEMETFSLLTNAKELNKDATTLLTVSDSYTEKRKLTPEEREKSLDDMIILALETSLKL